jgi:hypothetical protein
MTRASDHDQIVIFEVMDEDIDLADWRNAARIHTDSADLSLAIERMLSVSSLR